MKDKEKRKVSKSRVYWLNKRDINEIGGLLYPDEEFRPVKGEQQFGFQICEGSVKEERKTKNFKNSISKRLSEAHITSDYQRKKSKAYVLCSCVGC